MNRIESDRIKLIDALFHSIENENEVVFLPVIQSIKSDERKHFLSLSKYDFDISYCRSADSLNEKKRIITSLGRYIRMYYFGNKLSLQLQIELEKLVERTWIRVYKDIFPEVKILSGKDIPKHYKECDSRSESCMTGNDAWKTGIYSVNPKKISLAIMDNMRALLWTTDDGKKVLDQIYPVGDWKIPIFQNWANSKSFLYRIGKNDRKDIRRLNDGSVGSITLKRFSAPKKIKTNLNHIYPYIDTFCFMERISNGKVRVSNRYLNQPFILDSIYGNKSKILGTCIRCQVMVTSSLCWAGFMNSFQCENCAGDC